MPHAYEPGGRRFESCRAHHRIKYLRIALAGLLIFWSLHRNPFIRFGRECAWQVNCRDRYIREDRNSGRSCPRGCHIDRA